MLINQRKKDLRLVVITAIITTLIVSGIGVVAAKLTAKDIGFTSKHEGWEATNVEDAMNDLFKIGKYEITPDTYFYDSSTSGEEIVRYKKVEGKYYLCDKNGNVTSEEEQDVTGITLLEYTAATSANLSLGKAGFANTNFVLGDGTDNNNKKSGITHITSFTTTYHHGNNGSVSGTETHTVDIKQYTSNYQKLTNDDFISCFNSVPFGKNNISDTASRSGSLSVSHSYDASTGILTVNVNYKCEKNTWINVTQVYVYGVI